MATIKAIHDTVLKKKPIQSSTLKDNQKVIVPKGKSYDVELISNNSIKAHVKVTLMYGAGIWYIYKPHWDLNNKVPREEPRFPTGAPKPYLPVPPTKNMTIEAIVRYCIAVGVTKKYQIAYVLSTAEGESNFKPIKEMRGKYLTADQQKYWGSAYDGSNGYAGKGFIQVTWRRNYAKVGRELGVDTLGNPQLLLTYPVAIAALVIGMRDGWYTGKKLSDFNYGQYWEMRKMVNPGEIKYKRYWLRAKKFVTNAKKWERYLNKFESMYPGMN